MYLVDANVLVYSADSSAAQHEPAVRWLDSHLNQGPRTVGLPWPSLLAFLRLVTNPRIYTDPAPPEQAWDQVQDWLDRTAAWIPCPGPGHRNIMAHIMQSAKPTANLVPDAHLAALATEHGLTVVSTDSDFAKFNGITWLDPIRHTA